MTADGGPPARNLQRNLAATAPRPRSIAERLADLGDYCFFALLRRLPTDFVSDIGARLAMARGPTVFREAHDRSLANLKRLTEK